MPISARVILDSIQPEGVRLTTLVARIPKPIQAEFNTHREASRGDGQLADWLDLSRNSASSRAIPVEKMIWSVQDDPYIPRFTKNQKGMQGVPMEGPDLEEARAAWLAARDEAIDNVRWLLALEVHKQDANRLIEPFMHVDVVVSSVAWANFHAQRIHPMAHPAMQDIASAICVALGESVPKELYHGDWHLPFITEEVYGELPRSAEDAPMLIVAAWPDAAELARPAGQGRHRRSRRMAGHRRGVAQREINIGVAIHVGDPVAPGAGQVEREPAGPLVHPGHRHASEEVVGAVVQRTTRRVPLGVDAALTREQLGQARAVDGRHRWLPVSRGWWGRRRDRPG